MPKTISAEEFDRRFDEGEDMGDYIDWTLARRPGEGIERVDLDLTQRMAAKLDAAAARRGVTREALIRMWLSERLDRAAEGSTGTSAAA
ncbi:MAG TPA: ribbon-helix-helix protein, CopG family [Allosphingosinicella sp.]